uniref:PH_15 domain-containing protein n=1 Tax=Caenorhabditis tropicalis TaxID=1561998 RepID=A0A1I7U2A0_9PELO
MCTGKPKNIQLPDQHSLCSNPNSGCTYIEVKAGINKWDKCLAVLIKEDEEPKLYVYTYFLKGVGAGEPLIGRIYPLARSKELRARKEGDSITMTLVTEKRMELEFKLKGKTVGVWVAALMSGSTSLISHETHTKNQKPIKKLEAPPEKSKKSESTKVKSNREKRKEKSDKSLKKEREESSKSEKAKEKESISSDPVLDEEEEENDEISPE